jgi:hypothetical protein
VRVGVGAALLPGTGRGRDLPAALARGRTRAQATLGYVLVPGRLWCQTYDLVLHTNQRISCGYALAHKRLLGCVRRW